MAKDDNGYPTIFGVSHLDGLTPVAIQFDSNRKMLMDDTSTIQFSPSVETAQGTNSYPFAKATSSSNNKTVLPWVVNEYTGAVLVSL